MTTYPITVPDGSLLVTEKLVADAGAYLHNQYRLVWELFDPANKQCAAAVCLVRAMGYGGQEAEAEVERLGENTYFVALCNSLTRVYQRLLDTGVIR